MSWIQSQENVKRKGTLDRAMELLQAKYLPTYLQGSPVWHPCSLCPSNAFSVPWAVTQNQSLDSPLWIKSPQPQSLPCLTTHRSPQDLEKPRPDIRCSEVHYHFPFILIVFPTHPGPKMYTGNHVEGASHQTASGYPLIHGCSCCKFHPNPLTSSRQFRLYLLMPGHLLSQQVHLIVHSLYSDI